MKQTLLFPVLALAAAGAFAQEVGRVISSNPVIQQVAVPRTWCNQSAPVMVQPQTSGGGGLLGAIAGAAIGSTIGGGSGTAAAMLLGTVGGAIVGNNIEANNAPRAYATQPVCNTETSYENRAVGYDVTYEYAGREYTVQMPHDPGPTIPLQVSPVGGGYSGGYGGSYGGGPVVAPPVMAAQVAPAPVVVQPYAAYPAYPAYPVYAPYPAYRPAFPIGISFGYHYHGGHRHRR